MRVLVLVLAVLAGLKVWASNHTYRQATEDVIVAAYRERAIAACQKDAGHTAAETKQAADGKAAPEAGKASGEGAKGRLTVSAWAQPGSIRLVIGKPGPDARMWDLDSTRHKQAYLMLRPSGAAGGEMCEYDISANRASLVRG